MEKKILLALLLGASAYFVILLVLLSPTKFETGIQQSFLLSTISFDDVANRERLGYYQAAQELLFGSFSELMLGHGSGVFSLVQARSGGYELGVESSVLKIVMELGVLGAIPFFGVMIGTLRAALNNWTKKRDIASLFLFGCFLLVSLQLTTHELMKSWIGSVYFWLLAGGILHTKVFRRDSQRLNRAAA